MKDEEFFKKLRDDMHLTRHRRFQYQLSKIASIGSLIGVASILFDKMNINIFFYVVPFIAVAFDFYILGESFTLKRMAAFIFVYKSKFPDAELHWEQFVNDNPDKFSSIANFIITIASCIGALLILMLKNSKNIYSFINYLNLIWLFSLIILLILIRYVERKISKRAWKT